MISIQELFLLEVQRIMDSEPESLFEDVCNDVIRHYSAWSYGATDSPLVKLYSTPEFQTLKEKYKDRLTKPTDDESGEP